MKILTVFVTLLVLSSSSLIASLSWSDSPVDGQGMAEPRLFSFADIVREEKGAVVNIQSNQPLPGRGTSLGQEHTFWGLFGRIIPREFHERSLGTGFFIDKRGLILTNDHVVEGMERVIVKLSNGQEYDTKVIGRDSKTDIALLRVESDQEFPAVRFGDSKSIEVGEWVMAIGNPFGLEQTVTVGIVSAKGRMIGMGPYDDYIQTDASINPGNSGGPLFNVRGEVVGINTAIRSEGSGIGFAIPVHQFRSLIIQLEMNGKVTRGWLGVMIQNLTRESVENYNLKRMGSVLISDVFENSPAKEAGIRKGDIIVEFDGILLSRMQNLPTLVSETPVGKIVELRGIRKGKRQTFSVKIGKLED